MPKIRIRINSLLKKKVGYCACCTNAIYPDLLYLLYDYGMYLI